MNKSLLTESDQTSEQKDTITPETKSTSKTEELDVNLLTPAKDPNTIPPTPSSKRRARVINKRIVKEMGAKKPKRLKSKASSRDNNYDSNNSTANVYLDTLKKSLEEAFQENDKLRDRVQELEALLAAAYDEIEKKDNAILELAQNFEGEN